MRKPEPIRFRKTVEQDEMSILDVMHDKGVNNALKETYPSWILKKTEQYWQVYDHSSATTDHVHLYFNKEVADGFRLDEPVFSILRKELESAYLFWVEQGYVEKTNRLPSIHNNIIDFLYHANELRTQTNRNLILTLAQIQEEEFLAFIRCFGSSTEAVESILSIANSSDFIGTNANWKKLSESLPISRKEFSVIKSRIVKIRKPNFYQSTKSKKREFGQANESRGLEELHLPNLKTVRNITGDLDLLFYASSTQEFGLTFSPREVLSRNEDSIFHEFQSVRKTPVMPIETAFNLISNAAMYCYKYGESLLDYIKAIDIKLDNEKLRNDVKTLKSKEFQQTFFSSIAIPSELSDLKINCIGFKYEDTDNAMGFHRDGMSLYTAIELYFAAMYILLTSNSATRKLSINLLRRDCFNLSILDGLCELVFKQLKTRNARDSKIISRPIHSRVYDFGLQLIELSSYLESRHGINIPNAEGFLFTSFLRKDLFTTININQAKHTSPNGVSDDFIQDSLDKFSDWCRTPLIEGKRWYCNSHQLRRTFAVLYFNLTNENGIEELAWMLGHDSLETTYGYAELHPTEEWLEEAKAYLARHASEIISKKHASQDIINIIKHSQSASLNISLQLEDIVYEAINQRIKETGEQVHFQKAESGELYFFFNKGVGCE